jgi:nicotinamidase-related amidase
MVKEENLTMQDYSLIIIDVQDKFLNDLYSADRQRVIEAVTREVEAAKASGQGIVVCEYDVERRGDSAQFLLDLLDGYDRYLRYEHTARAMGRESLAVLRQQRYPRKRVRICGLYRKTSVAETAEECQYCMNYQLEVEIVEDACADLGKPFSLSIG